MFPFVPFARMGRLVGDPGVEPRSSGGVVFIERHDGWDGRGTGGGEPGLVVVVWNPGWVVDDGSIPVHQTPPQSKEGYPTPPHPQPRDRMDRSETGGPWGFAGESRGSIQTDRSSLRTSKGQGLGKGPTLPNGEA